MTVSLFFAFLVFPPPHQVEYPVEDALVLQVLKLVIELLAEVRLLLPVSDRSSQLVYPGGDLLRGDR
jgi:hypothetical protein